jgi:protein TonB
VRHDLDAALAEQKFLAYVVGAGSLELVKSVQPSYPKKASQSKIQGWVELDFTVAESGVVKDVAVHAASVPGVFDDAAIGALSQWHYKPVRRDGPPAPQRARIRIRFVLAER